MSELIYFSNFMPKMYMEKIIPLLKEKYWSVEHSILILIKLDFTRSGYDSVTIENISKIAQEKANIFFNGIIENEIVYLNKDNVKYKSIESDNFRIMSLIDGLEYFIKDGQFYQFKKVDYHPNLRFLTESQKKSLGRLVYSKDVIDYARKNYCWFPEYWEDSSDILFGSTVQSKKMEFTPETVRFENIACDLKSFVDGFEQLKKRRNPGAQGLHVQYDKLVACGVWYMLSALCDPKSKCLCRHNKLAEIAFENAVDQNGVHIKDQCADPPLLRDKLKKEALSLVPPERQYRNRGKDLTYDPDKCVCPIEWHQQRSGQGKGPTAK